MAEYRQWHWYFMHLGGVPDPVPRALSRIGGLVASLGGGGDKFRPEIIHPAMALDNASIGKRYEDRDEDEQDHFVKGLMTTMTTVGKTDAK